MTCCIPTFNTAPAVRPNGASHVPLRQSSPETRPTPPAARRRTPDEDRAFEAAVRWFLAVSAAA